MIFLTDLTKYQKQRYNSVFLLMVEGFPLAYSTDVCLLGKEIDGFVKSEMPGNDRHR